MEEPLTVEAAIQDEDERICDYLDSNSFIDTANHFQITIQEIKDAIIRYNKNQKDPVFKHCNHEFIIFHIRHKHGIENEVHCQKCRLSSYGNAERLAHNYPNCTIVGNLFKDCTRGGCEFCQ
jgi:hypothetical protein